MTRKRKSTPRGSSAVKDVAKVAHDQRLNILVTEAQRVKLLQLAAAEGLNSSQWVRRQIEDRTV